MYLDLANLLIVLKNSPRIDACIWLYGGSKMEGDTWTRAEFSEVELGDSRLSDRLRKLTEALLANPELPINGAMNGEWAATKAAYRFFSNKKVTPHQVLLPHRQKTVERIKQNSVVLAIQDTTYLNFKDHHACKGLGFIGTESLKGIVAHTTLCCTTEGLPLGIVEQKLYTRKEVKDETSPLIASLPIAMKESIRWLESMRMIATLETGSAQIVSVCDREGDITEFLAEAEKLGVNYLVRSNYNRRLKSTETGGLHDVVLIFISWATDFKKMGHPQKQILKLITGA
jgi:hypothetical protein